MRDDTHTPYAACTVCGEDFAEGVAEGYEVCTGCGCENEYDGIMRGGELGAKAGDVCYLTNGHLGECEFTPPSPEPTPEEMAEVYRSLGVTPDESGTLL